MNRLITEVSMTTARLIEQGCLESFEALNSIGKFNFEEAKKIVVLVVQGVQDRMSEVMRDE